MLSVQSVVILSRAVRRSGSGAPTHGSATLEYGCSGSERRCCGSPPRHARLRGAARPAVVDQRHGLRDHLGRQARRAQRRQHREPRDRRLHHRVAHRDAARGHRGGVGRGARRHAHGRLLEARGAGGDPAQRRRYASDHRSPPVWDALEGLGRRTTEVEQRRARRAGRGTVSSRDFPHPHRPCALSAPSVSSPPPRRWPSPAVSPPRSRRRRRPPRPRPPPRAPPTSRRWTRSSPRSTTSSPAPRGPQIHYHQFQIIAGFVEE